MPFRHTNWWTGQNKVVSQRVNLISNSSNSLLIIITPCHRGRISNTVLLRLTQENEVESVILYLPNVRNQNQTQNRPDSSQHHSVHSDACLRLHPSNSPTNKIQKHVWHNVIHKCLSLALSPSILTHDWVRNNKGIYLSWNNCAPYCSIPNAQFFKTVGLLIHCIG